MLKRHTKEIIIIVCICFVSIALGILSYINTPVVREYALSGEIYSIYDNNLSEIVDYDVDGNIFTPTSNDPQIVFNLDSITLNCVEVLLSKPLQEDIYAQVYFDNEGELSEDYSHRVPAIKGADRIFISVPYGVYSVIRVDINGVFELDNIHISDDFIFTGLVKINSYDFVLYPLLVCTFFTVIVILLSRYNKLVDILGYFKSSYTAAKQNKKGILLTLLIVIVMLLIACAIEIIVAENVYKTQFIWQRFVFIATAFLCLPLIRIFREKPEKLFLSISLLIGTMYAITMPFWISWDEAIHYRGAVQHASVFRPYFLEPDVNIAAMSTQRNNFFEYHINKYLSTLYRDIGYIPSGVGIFLGRSLNLPWMAIFILGRLGNMIAYSTVFYFAIKRINYGKYVLSVIGLIPTTIFLAANYSYDSWVIAWLALGASYFIAELQEPDKPAKTINLVIMLLAFVIGLGPKAVYVPMMLPLYFIGKSKFNNPKHYKRYMLILTAAGAFVATSFMVPFLFGSGGAGEGFTDSRGGEAVNSVEQMYNVIYNPIIYAKNLLNYLAGYLNISNSVYSLVRYAYLGTHTEILTLMIIFYTAVIFTDKNVRCEKINTPIKVATLFSHFIAVVLIVTALYISFTPVGSPTINGVQSRYLLPFVAPLLITLRSWQIQTPLKQSYYSAVVFGFCAYFLLSGAWMAWISL